MRNLKIPFGKLEFGSIFIDPRTNMELIKIEENVAEIIDDPDNFLMNVEISEVQWNKDDIVLV